MIRRALQFVLAACLVSCTFAAVRAETPEDTFAAACHDYEQGRWDAAADGFRSLLRYGFADWRLEYNLANTEYKRGRLGESILHYERARRLQPSDREILGNLAIARGRIKDVVDDEDAPGLLRTVRTAQDRAGVGTQAALWLVGWWLIAGIVTWCGARPGGFTPAWGWTLAAAVLVTALSFLSWRATWSRLEGTPRVVIQKPAVEALAGPGLNNAPLFTLHEGTAATVQGEREDWLQLTLPNGLTGWVTRDAAERI